MSHEDQLSLRAPLARSRRPAALEQPAAPARHLQGRDVAMGRILLAMILFGTIVGLAFPFFVHPFVTVRDGAEPVFRLACVVAGICVGGFAYAVARFTLFRANERLVELAAYDELTGLCNRRQFVLTLDKELARARREGTEVSLVIADLDFFKQVNDRLGHLTGDETLAGVAHCLSASIRAGDTGCRIGGEEFAAILPGASPVEAMAIAERLRSCVATRPCAGPAVTVSCGIASYPGDATTARSLITKADDAMYAAKAAGRDAVRTWAGACAPARHD